MTCIVIIFFIGLFSGISTAQTRIPEDCGGNHTGMSASITSPDFGSLNYPPSYICNWFISVPRDMVVEFRFQSIDLEDGLNCRFDGVILFDNNHASKINITHQSNENYLGKTKFCGNKTYPVIVSKTNSVGVIFYSDLHNERTGFKLDWRAIAVEDSFNCTFDQGLCNGWTNLGLYDDDFEWTINKKSTPTGGTGPSFDHTVQNEHGAYVFIETSLPTKTNDFAILVSPPIWFDFQVSTACVSFWYHMLGFHIGTLLVAKNESHYPVWWVRSGEAGRSWLNGKIQIQNLSEPLTLAFIGIKGSGFGGDIALDDVTVTKGNCKNFNQDFDDKRGNLKDYLVPEESNNPTIPPPPPPPIDIITTDSSYNDTTEVPRIEEDPTDGFIRDKKNITTNSSQITLWKLLHKKSNINTLAVFTTNLSETTAVKKYELKTTENMTTQNNTQKRISTLENHQELSTTSITLSITANNSFEGLLNSPTKLPKIKVELTTSGSATNHYFKSLSLQHAAILALTAIYLL